MFSVRFTIGLLLFLLVPFYIRFKYSLLEPFPAVLMPVGATKIRQDSNCINITYTALYGVAKNGTWQKLDPQLFINPIPLQYFTNVTATDFGLQNNAAQNRQHNGTLFRFLIKIHWLADRPRTQQDTAEIKVWLRKKVTAQGLTPATLKAVAMEETISLKTNTTVSKKALHETIIPLDQ